MSTDNEQLLEDPLYLGLPQRRLRGEAYNALIDEFFAAVAAVFPRAVVQLEDFATNNAFRLLEKYRASHCCFDDDIQGTAGVALAGVYSALRITKSGLEDHPYRFLGAGEAGIGIGNLIVSALVHDGWEVSEARRRCWFFDSKGLVVASRSDLARHKRTFAHEGDFTADFLEAVERLKPAATIGVSGRPQTFTRPVLEAMARIHDRPVVFALSNRPPRRSARRGRPTSGPTAARSTRPAARSPPWTSVAGASCPGRATTRTSSPAWGSG